MAPESRPRFWSQGPDILYPRRETLAINATCDHLVHKGTWNSMHNETVDVTSVDGLKEIMGKLFRQALSAHEALDCPATPVVSVSSAKYELTNLRPEQRVGMGRRG